MEQWRTYDDKPICFHSRTTRIYRSLIHDIIFGWDFFKATEAVIDCGRNELNIGETSVLESREEENQRLFASDDFVIPPKSIKISVMNEEIRGVYYKSFSEPLRSIARKVFTRNYAPECKTQLRNIRKGQHPQHPPKYQDWLSVHHHSGPTTFELWISQLEAAFVLAEISRDETKFQATTTYTKHTANGLSSGLTKHSHSAEAHQQLMTQIQDLHTQIEALKSSMDTPHNRYPNASAFNHATSRSRETNTPADIPLWLSQLEAAFIFANIASDDEFKYNATIINLDRLALICLYDIVENSSVSGKYAALKERLLQRFGRSHQVRTARVSETQPIADQRPSIILVELSKTPPSQHCGPYTPTSNSLQHLEQMAFPPDNPLPQQPLSHEEPLPPSCEQKHPLFLKETNNAAERTSLHLQPAQTSVSQPLQHQNTLQQSSPPIEARGTTSLIPIAPPVLSATIPIAEQPIVSLQANKIVATYYIWPTFKNDRCLPQAAKTRSQPNNAPYQEFPLRLHRIFKNGGVVWRPHFASESVNWDKASLHIRAVVWRSDYACARDVIRHCWPLAS
ncbi:transposition [Cordylochernes scorpioides]|uniref:Transposition n=1 Tax=Cordylochernes scorpioides TaxID=51811 RepID=A0ABY6KVK1_9ARAC|nr:transposition [Cordylochernes scorpioides]